MAIVQATPISCGILEIHHLEETDSPVGLERLYTGECIRQGFNHPFVIFSDNETRGEGMRLAAGLQKRGHSVSKSKPEMNPNTRRQIRLFVWKPSEELRDATQKAIRGGR